MHAATIHLMPILGAEKSKTAFYIAGALLVVWALVVSVGLGLRNEKFPATQTESRAVIGLTALLVLATAATAIITSGGSTASTNSAAAPEPATTSPAPAVTSTSAATSSSASAVTSTSAGTSSSAPAAPSAPLQLAANPEGQLSYSTKQLAAKAGKVTIDFANASPVAHNVVIAQGSKALGQTPIKTGSAALTVTLKPGTYTFFCAVPGHRQAGMEGTLTIS